MESYNRSAMLDTLHRCCSNPRYEACIVAATREEAGAVFDEILRMVEDNSEMNGMAYLIRKFDRKIHFNNGSNVSVGIAEAGAIRKRFHYAICTDSVPDEFRKTILRQIKSRNYREEALMWEKWRQMDR